MTLVRQRQRNAGVPASWNARWTGGVPPPRHRVIVVIFLALFAFATLASAADIDRKDLLILGLSLEVDSTTVVADSGIPAAVQTKFGGKTNGDAPPDNGMTAVGELTGPGIDTPVRLVTKPGHLFQLPLLYEKGDYVLGNIRLVSADGKTLQTAIPSYANITVTKVLTTKLTVHQLTPDELRARGITVDANNYDVFTKKISGVVNQTLGYAASGWIGTFKEQSDMVGDENNSIVVLAWGKLIHENLLPEVAEAGLFKEYLIGEVQADFIDADDQEDLATSDRQRLRVDDPRYRDLVLCVFRRGNELVGVISECPEILKLREIVSVLNRDWVVVDHYFERLIGTDHCEAACEALPDPFDLKSSIGFQITDLDPSPFGEVGESWVKSGWLIVAFPGLDAFANVAGHHPERVTIEDATVLLSADTVYFDRVCDRE